MRGREEEYSQLLRPRFGIASKLKVHGRNVGHHQEAALTFGHHAILTRARELGWAYRERRLSFAATVDPLSFERYGVGGRVDTSSVRLYEKHIPISQSVSLSLSLSLSLVQVILLSIRTRSSLKVPSWREPLR